jgi:hypothetical protein
VKSRPTPATLVAPLLISGCAGGGTTPSEPTRKDSVRLTHFSKVEGFHCSA